MQTIHPLASAQLARVPRRRCDFIQELQRAVNLYSRGGRDVLPEIYEYVEAPTIGNSHIGAFIITCLC